ncbi:MAG: CsgG/HfaB family protein [Armatimonadota bacterium]
MNLRKHERLYRLVSCVTVFGFILPLMLTVFPQAAVAQSQAQTPMQVGVVEFRNDSGVQGSMLARFATDAVVIELSKSDRFDVITRAQIDAQMKDLGIANPLNSVERNRLGEALYADAMIEGSIKAVELRGSGSTRRAAVTIVIRMVDQSSGEVINGAIQTGTSNVRVGSSPDDDKLISEAINNAAYQAVKTMIDYIIPEATVQNTIRTNEILLNKGARDGIRLGMRMIVTRDREIIGEVEIRKVDPDNATGFIVKQTRGISPEDKARAVFDMPEIARVQADSGTKSGPPTVSSKKSSSLPKIGRVLLGVLVAWGVSKIFDSDGTESVGGVTAEAGLSGYNLPVESGSPGVRVKWDASKLGRGKNVIEYHIWRNDVSGPVLTARASDGVAFDDANTRSTAYTTANSETNAKTTGTTTVPAMTLSTPLKYWVSALYMVQSSDSTLYYETDKVATGQATPMSQIAVANLTLPAAGSQQNLQKVTFEWLSRRGADVYIVEVSSDPTFQNPEYVSSPVYYSPAADGQTVRLVVSASLYNLFSSTTSDQPIWWRVGMRASGDSPGPIPASGRSSMRYLYSEINSFYPADTPPGTPDQ